MTRKPKSHAGPARSEPAADHSHGPAAPSAAPDTAGDESAGRPAPASADEAATEERDWRAGLDGELKSVAAKFASPADLAKSYAELERKLGRAVVPPGPGAGEDEIRAFRKRLGVPETPEGYEIAPPEDLPDHLRPDGEAEARQQAFLEAMHAAGATPEAVNAAVGWYYRELAALDAVRARQAREERETLEAELRREWGGDFEANVELGRRAARAFADEATLARLEEIVGSPSLLRLFVSIGRRMGEDTPFTARAGGGDHKALDEELAELRRRDDYWNNGKVQARVREIHERLHGTGAVRADER